MKYNTRPEKSIIPSINIAINVLRWEGAGSMGKNMNLIMVNNYVW